MADKALNEADIVKDRFISGLGRLSTHQQAIVDTQEFDMRSENKTFIIFCVILGLMIAISVIIIALVDPFYQRTSGNVAEFFMTLGIHAIIMTGILKSIRQDEPVIKHILAGLSATMFLGALMLLLRILIVPDKPMVWVIIPLLAKFSFLDNVSTWFTFGCAVVPMILQFLLLALFYKTERLSLALPYITYVFVANSIVAFIMLSPLVGGV
jgi:hypothetical protein